MNKHEVEGSLSEKDREFKFPRETTSADSREIDLEKKFEVEIKKEDIEGIKQRMEQERKKEGISGKQSLTFEGAALARLAEEAPEADIEKFELSKEDVDNCKKRLESDIVGAVDIKTKAGEEKGLSKEEISEVIKSEQIWIVEFQKSYLKDALGPERFKEEALETSEEEWKGMAEDLKKLIDKKDWHNVIPRAGHMHNLEPEKFDKEILSLFTEEDREGILEEIETLRHGNPDENRKANPWELASRVRYVSEFMPELKSRIKLDEKDWKAMHDRLETVRKDNDYWAGSYQLCNMKIIEGLAKRGEISIIDKKD